ncbi:FAD-dependent monooxygenase [Halomonas sp. Bachu 37]|uniref:FAD-dependent monooxygenase n=1 Tax=Halomonas kashgarensis TaxID=3084920 RepID=UPI0032165884
MQVDHDILIIGGGMVGAALAARLASAGLSIGMVERGDKPTAPEGDYDLRISSLNVRSLELIQDGGTLLPEDRLCPFRHIEVWSQGGGGHSLFSSADSELERFGVFIENQALQHALWQRLETLSNATIYTHCSPVATLAGRGSRFVELDDGRSLSARLVVGADGARSRLRELVGIPVSTYDYHQRALIINVETELPQQDTSWQCFTPTGPLAMLPLPGHRASLVWYDEEASATVRESLDDDALTQAIERSFPARLGGITRITGRAGFPIKRQHAQRYTTNRLVLIGDAAHVVHPLAGQGLNLGLHDAASLADTILLGEDPGDARDLRRFALQRRLANQAMLTATDGFHHLFTGPEPLRRLGDLGLQLSEHLPAAKRWMMRQASGLN